jgi:outer membrane protein
MLGMKQQLYNYKKMMTMKRIKLYVLTGLWLCSLEFRAQSVISLDQAIQIALSNNLDLQISRNDAQIAHNNNYAGNAGMLPSVTLNAGENPSLMDINQKFTNGTSIEKNSVFSHAATANVTATYTLFDGNRMFATRRKLEYQDIAANNILKANIQNTISLVIMNYSNIVRQQKYLDLLRLLNNLSSQRLEIVKSRQQAGLANNTDLYLAQLDLETRKQNILAQEALIKNVYTDLNLVLNIKADSIYQVEEFSLAKNHLVKSDLDSMLKQNPELMLARNQVDIALQTQKEIGAARLPLVRLSAAYVYNISQSQAGFSLYNQSNGPQAGLTLSVPLFTGGVNQRNYENAKLNVESSELRQQQTMISLQGLYAQSWQNYMAAINQLQSDSLAITTAKNYIELMQQRFSAGQNTIIELKEAQRSYEETYYRFISNQYIARLAETQLLSLTGQLVK